jgi:hypothetical protein
MFNPRARAETMTAKNITVRLVMTSAAALSQMPASTNEPAVISIQGTKIATKLIIS